MASRFEITRVYEFKILLVGDASTGKTCIASKFCDNYWTEKHLGTQKQTVKTKTFLLNSKKLKLKIIDLPGVSRFDYIRSKHYKDADAIILVFDLSNARSFENISYWTKELIRYDGENARRVLVGNKADLSSMREVPDGDGKKYALEIAVPYFSVSAKAGDGLGELFKFLSTKLLFDVMIKEGDLLPPQSAPKCFGMPAELEHIKQQQQLSLVAGAGDIGVYRRRRMQGAVIGKSTQRVNKRARRHAVDLQNNWEGDEIVEEDDDTFYYLVPALPGDETRRHEKPVEETTASICCFFCLFCSPLIGVLALFILLDMTDYEL